MKKLLSLLMSCLILGACTTLTLEQKRERFEQEMPKPVFECDNVGKMPTDVVVSEDEIGVYDYEGCDFSSNGMRPIQQINSREFLAYLCGSFGCSASQIYHVRFPYAVRQLGVNSYYEFPDDICMSSTGVRRYSYTTQYGLKNTIVSVNLIKVKLASKAKRKQKLENLKTKKLEEAQQKWREEYEEQQRCLSASSAILEKWKQGNDTRTFCEEIRKLRRCDSYSDGLVIHVSCGWNGVRQKKAKSFEHYFLDNCVH